jgi:5-formyltetrahydrofolate cyclo-ligase
MRLVAMDPGVENLDLILVPGVAFDENCNRVCRLPDILSLELIYQLGRGKAFYDDYLAKYISQKGHRPLLGMSKL